MSYSYDIRRLVVQHIKEGGSHSEAVHVFGISSKTIYNWMQRGEDNLAATSPPGRTPRIDRSKLCKDVEEVGDRLLRERAEAFAATPSGIWRALRASGISKKNNAICTEESHQEDSVSA